MWLSKGEYQMRKFPFGFSKRCSQSTAGFNPLPGSSEEANIPENIKATNLTAKYRCTPRLILKGSIQQSVMSSTLTKRVGHAQVQIRDYRKARKSLLHDDWFGTAKVGKEVFPFTTNNEQLETNQKYHIVYEKVENPTGEAGIKIHDVIS